MKKFQKVSVVLTSLSLLLAGCGHKEVPANRHAVVPPAAITCIAVAPSVSEVNNDPSLRYEDAKNLIAGGKVLDQILKEEFGGNEKVRFLPREFMLAADPATDEKPLDRLRSIGKSLSCNAVLETTMLRYKERVGGELTAESPASVAFVYRLVSLDKGEVLCRGVFDETQQSLFDNLFGLQKAKARGFTWITAEQLLREGVHDKFSDCGYLVEK